MNYCKKCGNEIGDTTAIDGLCSDCRLKQQVEPPTYNPGWVCPKCGSVYGPFVNQCGRCNKSQYEITCKTGATIT